MFRSILIVLSIFSTVGAFAPSASAQHGHHGRVGLLIADHGEPPEYNAQTYESFRGFIDHLLEMGVIPPSLRSLDTGTIAQDRDCYACSPARPSPELIDAWLRPASGLALPMPAFGHNVPAHHLIAGGPGAGEPDVFEHGGLTTWHEWQLMGGRSPNYAQKLAKKRVVIRRLRTRYRRRLPIRVGYGIDPRIGGERQGIAEAVTALVRKDRVKRIVVVYHGVGSSDIMQTHMVRHEAEHVAHELDHSVNLSYAQPMGTTRPYLQAVVRKVKREVAALPRGARAAVHLSGHGLATGMCGNYDCGGDSYHRSARRLFARAKAALRQRLPRLRVFHVYGDGGSGDDDPANAVHSPLEALDARVAAGFTHVIDVPYEFDSDSRDTLIVLREGYGRTPPDWNARYESRFEYKGLTVRITGASFGRKLKIRALELVARTALGRAGL